VEYDASNVEAESGEYTQCLYRGRGDEPMVRESAWEHLRAPLREGIAEVRLLLCYMRIEEAVSAMSYGTPVHAPCSAMGDNCGR